MKFNKIKTRIKCSVLGHCFHKELGPFIKVKKDQPTECGKRYDARRKCCKCSLAEYGKYTNMRIIGSATIIEKTGWNSFDEYKEDEVKRPADKIVD